MNEVSAGFARGGAATTAALASMPADLRRAVFIAGDGEVAWPVYRAVDAAFWLAAHGSALVAGELYQRLPESYWGTFVDEWTMAPGRLAGELWATYVQRSLGQARGQIEAWMANATNEFKVCLIVESEPCAPSIKLRCPPPRRSSDVS